MSIKIFNIVKSLYIFKFENFNMNHKIYEKHETHYAPINGSGQSGYRLNRVGLTCIFHIKFFIFKKTICVCHLESHATNYLM